MLNEQSVKNKSKCITTGIRRCRFSLMTTILGKQSFQMSQENNFDKINCTVT